jgi:MFS family permease
MHGLAGLNGWQWIFIIEGIVTVVLGILAYLYAPDFPDRNTFLTPEQTTVGLKFSHSFFSSESSLIDESMHSWCFRGLKRIEATHYPTQSPSRKEWYT